MVTIRIIIGAPRALRRALKSYLEHLNLGKCSEVDNIVFLRLLDFHNRSQPAIVTLDMEPFE